MRAGDLSLGSSGCHCSFGLGHFPAVPYSRSNVYLPVNIVHGNGYSGSLLVHMWLQIVIYSMVLMCGNMHVLLRKSYSVMILKL